MQELGISQQTLAESLGSTRGAVGHYLSGRRNPNLKQIHHITEILMVSPAWLLYGQGAMEIQDSRAEYSPNQTGEYVVPVTGTTGSGPGNVIGGQSGLVLRLNKCYALSISGTDYSPRMYEGELILIDPDLDPVPGDEVIIKSDNIVELYTVINIRGQKITVNSLHKQPERKVFNISDIQYIHCIVAIVRDNIIQRTPD